jgi:hypothetical protein
VRRNRIVSMALAIGLIVLGCNLLSTAVPGPTGSLTVTSLPILAPTTEPSLAPAQPSLAAQYIGLPYPPVPEGWLAGLGGISAYVGDTSFSIQELEKADKHMLWFMKFTGQSLQLVAWILHDYHIPG